MNDTDHTVSKYDRLRGQLKDDALFTKPSTIQNVESITGRAETFIVVTARYRDNGDYVFVECLDDTGHTRVCLPPRVSDAIARQRESLTARRRSITARKVARERMAAGEVPGFMRKRKA